MVATKFSRSAAGSGALRPESHAFGVAAVTPKGQNCTRINRLHPPGQGRVVPNGTVVPKNGAPS